MKYSSIHAGDTYYTVSRHKMGNTTLSTVAVHRVKVISCDSVKETVTASWNGNAARTYFQRDYSKWRATEPLLIRSGLMGAARLATRDEIKAHKAASGTAANQGEQQ